MNERQGQHPWRLLYNFCVLCNGEFFIHFHPYRLTISPWIPPSEQIGLALAHA